MDGNIVPVLPADAPHLPGALAYFGVNPVRAGMLAEALEHRRRCARAYAPVEDDTLVNRA